MMFRDPLWSVASIAVAALLAAAPAAAQPLTVDRAVDMALRASSLSIGAEAGVLDARGGLYGAYAGVLPRVSAGVSRSMSGTDAQTGSQVFGSFVTPSTTSDRESYSTSPTLSGSWNVLNLSSLSGLSSARNALKAAQLSRASTRNDVVLQTKRQFYEVVKAVHLANVRTGALQLARDDERRVRALFEVGSVSRSDVLSAQVRTAQSELDSLVAQQSITAQRSLLASLVGVAEEAMGDVDTSLTAQPQTFDEAQILEEASRARPDLQAAEADLKSARAGVNAARFQRLPYVSVRGSMTFSPTSSTKFTEKDSMSIVTRSESDRDYSAAISLDWDFFDGLATDARVASARARLLRARDAHDALRRNLASEVRQTHLGYLRAVESDRVARRAVESAEENLKLTQQKYNVGSATILELIDAQVQLEQAQSNRVSALSAIRVAEAELDRVRGRGAR